MRENGSSFNAGELSDRILVQPSHAACVDNILVLYDRESGKLQSLKIIFSHDDSLAAAEEYGAPCVVGAHWTHVIGLEQNSIVLFSDSLQEMQVVKIIEHSSAEFTFGHKVTESATSPWQHVAVFSV